MPPLLIKMTGSLYHSRRLLICRRELLAQDIIGNREKGIPAIIPVGKSTWYAGVKTGRYPKSFSVRRSRCARGSDIYTLLQQLRMI